MCGCLSGFDSIRLADLIAKNVRFVRGRLGSPVTVVVFMGASVYHVLKFRSGLIIIQFLGTQSNDSKNSN